MPSSKKSCSTLSPPTCRSTRQRHRHGRFGRARFGAAGVGQGRVWFGAAGSVGRGEVGRGWPWFGPVRFGMAGTPRFGSVRCGAVASGTPRFGRLRSGTAGSVRWGAIGFGQVWSGWRQGVIWHGRAGKVRYAQCDVSPASLALAAHSRPLRLGRGVPGATRAEPRAPHHALPSRERAAP